MIVESAAILIVVAAFAVLQSSKALRWVAAWLVARAEALDAFDRAQADGLEHWRDRLGVHSGKPFDLAVLRKRAGAGQ